MTQPQPTQSDVMGGVLQRLHQLGGATADLFNRVYGGLNRHKQLTEAMTQLEKIEVRNRQLRQALQEQSIESQRLQGILASISEGIIMQDTKGRIVMMNSAAETLLGSKRNFWSSELKVLFNERRDIPTKGNELAPLGEATHVTIDNRVVSAQIAAITDQNNDRIGTLMILRDATSKDISHKMKDSFVTHISHELITPLAPMRVASEILLATPEDKPVNRRMLEMISKNVDILDRLVTEMLDMSAMTSGTFQLAYDRVDVEAIIWDVVSGFAADLQDNKQEIILMLKETDALQITADQKHLRWAFSNVVRNAIQYSPAGSTVWVATGVEATAPHQIFVEVADTGVGISEDDLPHIFDLFYRGDARTENGKKLDPRGLGQGLYVTQRVVNAHKGTLDIDTTLYQGTTVRMTIPRNTPMALPS
ncbi:MAG: ATP-binding protein [Chloroflexota bacterium]